MDNNINLVSAKKKKYRRRKKPFIKPIPQPPVDPAATLQGLKTIANLLQIHKQLTLKGHKPKQNYGSNNQPKPLMSEPRIKKPMFSGHVIPAFSKFKQQSMNQPSTSNSKSFEKNITSDTGENFAQDISFSSDLQKSDGVQNNQNLQSDSLNRNTIKPFSDTKIVKEPNLSIVRQTSTNDQIQCIQSKNNQDLLNSKSLLNPQENKFDDFEIYNSPTFINFETSEAVELNDDNLNVNMSISSNVTRNMEQEKTIKKNTAPNFQTKLQNRYGKKLETTNLIEVKQTPTRQALINIPLNVTGQDDDKKKANKELVEALSSDINTVVQDNIKSNVWQRKPQQTQEPAFERYPSGIPRSFLQQNWLATPQSSTQIGPKEHPISSNISQPVQWTTDQSVSSDKQLSVQTQNVKLTQPQAYSPTDVYQDMQINEDLRDSSESPDMLDSSSKRVSAFHRLGPLSQPKKPKLTINLSLNKEEAVREVVNETNVHIPVHDREAINQSTDEIVMKYLPYWPWKKTVVERKTVTVRNSKTVMMMEKEQMEEVYERDSSIIMVSVRGYPPTWTKERVLDVLLDNLKGNSFIPCFIDFTTKECKFFVIRSRGALLSIHWFGFVIRTEDVELTIKIAQTLLTVKQIDFIPRLVLRKRLAALYSVDKLDLSEFTLKEDISHFIYFPLYREYNQSELVQLKSDVDWDRLTELDLSHNRITTIEGFDFKKTTPHLKVLNLSHNHIESALIFLPCKNLPLKSLKLEGNPLCLDYTDADYYVKVMRTMFPSLRELDGVPITLKGDLPMYKKNYCPEGAEVVIEKFLEIFFPLLDAEGDERMAIQDLYSKKAVMTISCKSKLRYDSTYKLLRKFAIKSQNLLEGNLDTVEGRTSIGKLIKKWPHVDHDPTTFTTDVMYHDDSTTIFNITGILKIRADSLAEDEPLASFSRTVVLSTRNGCKYKIQNELLYWDEPIEQFSRVAFQSVLVSRKTPSLKFETTPDDDTKSRLLKIFMEVTESDEKASARCLESKSWHFQHALEYYIKLLKLDNVQTLND